MRAAQTPPRPSLHKNSFESSSIIAGYSMAHRRPFKLGDRIKINDTVGEVAEIRVLVTRLRSLKIVSPDANGLGGKVINYSTSAETACDLTQIKVTAAPLGDHRPLGKHP